MDETTIQRMYQLAGIDADHQRCKTVMEAREPKYLDLRARLSEEDQDTLDLYIAACEELSFHYVYIAYALGRGSAST